MCSGAAVAVTTRRTKAGVAAHSERRARRQLVDCTRDPWGASPLAWSSALKWAAEDRIPLSEVLARITMAPAAILGIDAGHFGVGAKADVCVFDPALHWRVEPAALRSQGKNTPFLGLEVPGKVRTTLVGGHVVFEG